MLASVNPASPSDHLAPELAAALTRALFCGFRSGECRVAVYVAYSDESEVGSPGGEFLFGGYVASESDWPCVSAAWQDRVLDGSPTIPYLHMREIRDENWRAERGISYNDAEERVSEAARVMNSFGNMAAITSIMRRADLEAVFHGGYRRRRYVPVGLNEPDYLCFIAYARHILGHVYRKWPDAQKVNFVVSRKQGITNHIATFRDAMQDFLAPPLKKLVGELIPASMELQVPLQCADVLLWHLQRYYACGRYQQGMDTCDRVRLAHLIQNGALDGRVHEWNRDELADMAENWTKAGLLRSAS
jgi:hypothetical protein